MVSMTHTETLQLLQAYGHRRDPGARERLVNSYVPLVRRLCRRFQGSREPQEDLYQVGVIGLLNAIERFDPQRGSSFSSFARPQVLGAILNYLRDHGTLIKVPRRTRQNRLTVYRASQRLSVWLRRPPTVAELAEACEMSEDDIHATIGVSGAVQPLSLDKVLDVDDSEGRVTLLDLLGDEDDQFSRSVDRITLAAALRMLPLRERAIVILKFYRGMSQRQIAGELNLSQMHISRLERRALLKLRLFILDHEEPDTGGVSEEQSDSRHLAAAS